MISHSVKYSPRLGNYIMKVHLTVVMSFEDGEDLRLRMIDIEF